MGSNGHPQDKHLASGGEDVINIRDRYVVSSNSTTRCLNRFEKHKIVVRALDWCRFQSNLLASGGGNGDQCIKQVQD